MIETPHTLPCPQIENSKLVHQLIPILFAAHALSIRQFDSFPNQPLFPLPRPLPFIKPLNSISNIYLPQNPSMDLNNQSTHEIEDVEPQELLEDCWFFGNLLQTKSKSRMLRSFSDPCSSMNFPGKSYEETYESIKKLSSSPATDRKERRSNRKSSSKNALVRAPSLPTSLETRDFHDEEEIEFSMGKLIRQASLNHSDNRPPRTKSSSLKSRRKPEAESVKPELNKLVKQMSLKDVETEYLQGFKDNLEENGGSIVPVLRRSNEEKITVRPYVTEAWGPPPVPRWGGKRSTEDMKAQIKFWARAVASNVRQEC